MMMAAYISGGKTAISAEKKEPVKGDDASASVVIFSEEKFL